MSLQTLETVAGIGRRGFLGTITATVALLFGLPDQVQALTSYWCCTLCYFPYGRCDELPVPCHCMWGWTCPHNFGWGQGSTIIYCGECFTDETWEDCRICNGSVWSCAEIIY